MKPDFWTDEKIVTLSPLARLLFIGLWNFCDDEGRREYSLLSIKLQILPLDPTDCSGEIGELRRNSLVLVYEVAGKQYLQITNFEKHQKVDKRTSSKFPPPPPTSAESPRIPPSPADGREGKGREEKGREEDKKETPASPSSGGRPPPPAPAYTHTREGLSPAPPPTPRTIPPPPPIEDHRRVRDFIVQRLPQLAARASPEIDQWLADGCDVDEDILPSVEHLIAVKGGDIGSFKFFTRSILSARDARQEAAAQHQRLMEKYRES